MNILVTGASGFVGRRLGLALARRLPDPLLHCWISPIRTDFEESGKRVLLAAGISCSEIDLLSLRKGSFPELQKSPSVIFHLAANTSTWAADQSANDIGTERMLAAFGPLGPETHVIFTSTIATMDNRDGFCSAVNPSIQFGEPLTRYGRSKLRAEEILIQTAREQGFRLTIVRLMTVYGPEPKPNSLLDVLKREVRSGSWRCRLNWPGKTGLVHVDDVVDALVMLATSEVETEKRINRLILQAEALTVAQISQLLHRALGFEYKPIQLPKAFWRLAWQGWKAARAVRLVLPTSLFNTCWRAHLAMENVFWADDQPLRILLPNWKPRKLRESIHEIVNQDKQANHEGTRTDMDGIEQPSFSPTYSVNHSGRGDEALICDRAKEEGRLVISGFTFRRELPQMTTKLQEIRRGFYDALAQFRPKEQERHYNRLLRHYYSHVIPPGSRVLEVGCGVGDLLAAVKPVKGVGIDFSEEAIRIARQRHKQHPHLEFCVADAESFEVAVSPHKEKATKDNIPSSSSSSPSVSSQVFDYVILSDLVNDLDDVQAVLEHLRRFAHPRTRLVLIFFNNVWHPILALAERFNLKAPTFLQNWLSSSDMRNLLALAGWEVIVQDQKILCPVRFPGAAGLLNRFVAPCSQWFCLTVFQVARLAEAETLENRLRSALRSSGRDGDFTCSVIIPARNEMGNIEGAVLRLPEMGAGTEIIFVEGHSKDGTWAEINQVADAHPERRIKVLKQKSKGKGGAVREAFEVATGDIVMILDADLTVPPEDLPKFFDALKRGRGEFINGVRLVYPMEERAMQFLNMIANKLFGLAFSWLIRQPIKDTLCGTKALFRRDYQEIARNRGYFGEFDPFGDFDLLFGAARLNLKIIDMPVRYRARTYGETNIQRWRHGALLLRMVAFGATRLRFL